MNWLNDIVRNFFFLLDGVVYTLIDWIYKLFISLAQINISKDVTDNFASRIYAFLGIFMLFRLAFSLITYLINPDNLKEQKKGGGALIRRIFISILLMAFVPAIFREAYDLQKTILEENILGKIIMGQTLPANKVNSDDSGQRMAYTVFSAFFYPKIDTVQSSGESTNPCDTPFDSEGLVANCKAKIEALGGSSVAQTYEEAYEQLRINHLSSILNAKTSTGEYVFEYKWAISTIAGGFVFWVFIIFTIDLALRVVKLAFLQLISPVPIISYIDPKEG